MGNLKHAIAAFVAVSLVGSLAAMQAIDFSSAKANKLTQEIETIEEAPAVLTGDGEGETADFSILSPELQLYIGKTGYILTSGGTINLRSSADTESTILNVLKLGDSVKIIDSDEEWFKVESGDYTGYVLSDFVTLDESKVWNALLTYTMYLTGTAVQSINVRGLADQTSLILSQIPQGESVIILESTGNGWYKVYFGEDYDIGYVSAEYITVGTMTERTTVNEKRNARLAKISKKAKIKGSDVKVMTLPSDNSQTITTLSNNADCKIVSGGSNWTKIIISATNEIGYVRTSNVEAIVVSAPKAKTSAGKDVVTPKNIPASGNGSKLVQQASKYLGTRYVYGGSSPSGFDCSGLVQYCLKNLGVSISRSSASQYSSGTPVSRANLQPGDLVFFAKGGGISHVAIYAGNGQVIHAPRAGKRVSYQSLDSLCSTSRYVGAKRVL